MKAVRLIDNETKGLAIIMQRLSELNKEIAIVYSESHNASEEMEDNNDYITIQSFIHSAIYQIGQTIGKNIAEKMI